MNPGEILFSVTLPPSGRANVADFSKATEDPNPIHVDDDFAKGAGFPTVLQQGPMTTCHFARLLEERFGPDRLALLDVTFTAPVFPDDSLTLTATIGADGSTIDLAAAKADGTPTARGSARLREAGR